MRVIAHAHAAGLAHQHAAMTPGDAIVGRLEHLIAQTQRVLDRPPPTLDLGPLLEALARPAPAAAPLPAAAPPVPVPPPPPPVDLAPVVQALQTLGTEWEGRYLAVVGMLQQGLERPLPAPAAPPVDPGPWLDAVAGLRVDWAREHARLVGGMASLEAGLAAMDRQLDGRQARTDAALAAHAAAVGAVGPPILAALAAAVQQLDRPAPALPPAPALDLQPVLTELAALRALLASQARISWWRRLWRWFRGHGG